MLTTEREYAAAMASRFKLASFRRPLLLRTIPTIQQSLLPRELAEPTMLLCLLARRTGIAKTNVTMATIHATLLATVRIGVLRCILAGWGVAVVVAGAAAADTTVEGRSRSRSWSRFASRVRRVDTWPDWAIGPSIGSGFAVMRTHGSEGMAVLTGLNVCADMLLVKATIIVVAGMITINVALAGSPTCRVDARVELVHEVMTMRSSCVWRRAGKIAALLLSRVVISLAHARLADVATDIVVIPMVPMALLLSGIAAGLTTLLVLLTFRCATVQQSLVVALSAFILICVVVLMMFVRAIGSNACRTCHSGIPAVMMLVLVTLAAVIAMISLIDALAMSQLLIITCLAIACAEVDVTVVGEAIVTEARVLTHVAVHGGIKLVQQIAAVWPCRVLARSS
jgi:hypothetical protein